MEICQFWLSRKKNFYDSTNKVHLVQNSYVLLTNACGGESKKDS